MKTPSGVKLLAFPRLSEGEREVLPLLCPACGGPMRILSFITDPFVVVAILEHVELPHTPPPILPPCPIVLPDLPRFPRP